MALQTQAVTVNFQQGLSQGTDPFQVPIGKFERLDNSVFDKIGRLTKRNGFGQIQSLPDTTSSFVTTFNGNLTAIGRDLKSFSPGPNLWTSKGQLLPLTLSVIPVINNSSNQTQVDTAISPNGLMCLVFSEDQTVQSTTQSHYKYSVVDASTGQSIIAPTRISSSFGSISHSARVFSLSNFFVVTFGSTASGGASSHLQYFSINSFNPNSVSSVTDISTSYAPQSTVPFDGVVANNSLYLTWSGAANSGIKSAKLNSNFTVSAEVTIASGSASLVSVTADNTQATPIIWSSYYVNGTNSGRAVATGTNLATLFSSVEFINSASAQLTNLASVAQYGAMNLFYESSNYYPYPVTGSVSTNYIATKSFTLTGSLSAQSIVSRAVGLASKGFIVGSESYLLSVYNSNFQPSYFLMNSTGGIVSKLAYSNARGYLTTGLPSVNVSATTATLGYLRRNQVQAINKDTNVSSVNQVAGVYTQTGINAASFAFGSQGLSVSEAGKNLNLTGGIGWAYDGNIVNENGFNVWPDYVSATNSASVGSITVQQYFYQVTYEWTDNQGNWFRSAPSIPVNVNVSSGTGTVNVIRVPTLRLTYKTSNPVKIVIYRWSQSQQTYYQTTSIDQPLLNDPSVDSVSFTDRNSDQAILGNNILYTTGGVLENIGAPPSTAVTLFDSRMWAIDAENDDLLWYSKTILDQTPVEMSDQLTRYVTPNASAQGPTGPMRCIAPMDDKLIIFKRNALYYINGTGPDSTGASSQYSEPIFITSTVGSENQNSIVLIPQGLMFQSDKGIWLLGRDLSTNYVGKDVEDFNSATVLSATAIPGTNQVRFTLDNGIVLLYDYFVGQWGTFSGISGISSTLYQNLHTYIDEYGRAFQENPGSYLDGTNPVLMSWRSGWLSLAGLQGYQRAYSMYMLGVYKSPHVLRAGVAYDYDSNVQQLATIAPTNFSGPWGSGTSWGSISYWGGNTSREQWEVNFQRQQCQSIQISFQEFYDPQFGVAAGAGLTMSGVAIVSGFKKGYPRNLSASNRTG